MKIHVLPTDKQSRLIYNDSNQLCYHSNKSLKNDRKWMYRKKFNIYITSDEIISPSEWCIDKNGIVHKFVKFMNYNHYKKIILTTDQDLINNGIQAINNKFLKWFIKNQSCESVEVIKHMVWGEEYKIIIPKLEPKQETL